MKWGMELRMSIRSSRLRATITAARWFFQSYECVGVLMVVQWMLADEGGGLKVGVNYAGISPRVHNA